MKYFSKIWLKENRLAKASKFLTRAQILQYKLLFNEYDTDNSGYISKDEFFSIKKVIYLGKESATILEDIFDEEYEHEEIVDFAHFLNILGRRKKLANKELMLREKIKEASKWLSKVQIKIKRIFDKYDQDDNGTISKEELYQVMRDLGKNKQDAEEAVEVILQNIDQDHSNYITFAEFLNSLGADYKNENQHLEIEQIDQDHNINNDLKNLRTILVEIILICRKNELDEDERLEISYNDYDFDSEAELYNILNKYIDDSKIKLYLYELNVLYQRYKLKNEIYIPKLLSSIIQYLNENNSSFLNLNKTLKMLLN